jgi:hypothetical protein
MAAYVVTGLAMLWPLTFSLGSSVAGWKDARYYAWVNWRIGEMLASGDIGLRIREIVWPYGIDVRLLDGQLPTLIGGLWNLVAAPSLAYNLGLLTGIGLNLWAGRRLGKAFSRHRAVWAITAVAFATAPAIAARLEVHFTMLFVFPVALLIEEAVVVGRGDRPIRPIRLGVLVVTAYLCGIYLLVFGSIAFASILLLATPGRALPGLALRGGAGFLLAIALLAPFLVARLELDRAERAAGRDPVLLENTFKAEADGLSVVAQPSSSTLQLPGMARLRERFRANIPESTIFPGFVLLLGIGALLFLRSPLRWPLLFTSIAIWIFALGTSLKIDGRYVVEGSDGQPFAWLPYTALFELPGLASLRSPNRAGFALAAVLAAAGASSLGWLFARFDRAWQHAAMIAASGALLVPNLLTPIHREAIAPSAPMRDALVTVAARVRPGESMIEVPADCGGQTHTVMLQILHRTPLVGCQTSYAAIPWASDIELYKTSVALAALRCRIHTVGRVRTSVVPEGFGADDLRSLREAFGARFFLIFGGKLRGARCAHVREAVAVLERSGTIAEGAGWAIVDTGPIGSEPTAAGGA